MSAWPGLVRVHQQEGKGEIMAGISKHSCGSVEKVQARARSCQLGTKRSPVTSPGFMSEPGTEGTGGEGVGDRYESSLHGTARGISEGAAKICE